MSKGKGGNVSAAVWQIAEPIASELGVSLWDIRFLKEGADWFLRIILDKEGGVGIDDCEAFSRAIDKPLDELDPIEDAYTLDISSLGAEKPLAVDKLPLYVGQYVSLHLSHPYKGENILEGTLMEVTADTVTLKVKEKAKRALIHFPYADVDKARLAIDM